MNKDSVNCDFTECFSYPCVICSAQHEEKGEIIASLAEMMKKHRERSKETRPLHAHLLCSGTHKRDSCACMYGHVYKLLYVHILYMYIAVCACTVWYVYMHAVYEVRITRQGLCLHIHPTQHAQSTAISFKLELPECPLSGSSTSLRGQPHFEINTFCHNSPMHHRCIYVCTKHWAKYLKHVMQTDNFEFSNVGGVFVGHITVYNNTVCVCYFH